MAVYDKNLIELAIKLFEAEAIKFGNYKMKSGTYSPIYFDLRVIVSYPKLLEQISSLLCKMLDVSDCDVLCGVPYTALPIATVMSIKSNVPMLIRRKETKQYGTKKLIEGKFNKGDKCIIIEDVITSGSSIIETVKDLRNEGLEVTQAIVIMDRQQGAAQNLKHNNISVKNLFDIIPFIEMLIQAGKIDDSMKKTVQDYLQNSQTTIKDVLPKTDRLKVSFEKRIEFCKNPISKKLFEVMVAKKTNLCVAADLTQTSEILKLFEDVAPFICMFKTHVDIIKDFDQNFIDRLKILSKKHNVVLMEDRKYSDIGNTVSLQCNGGIFKVSDWADTVTVHSLPGSGILTGIKNGFSQTLRGVFVVAEMSSEGNLATPQYIESTMKMVETDCESVTGIVCQNKDTVQSLGLIQLTPGVKIDNSTDNMGQNYNTPEKIMCENGADIAVVGRGIIAAENPKIEAEKYRNILWKCYESRVR